MKRRTLAFLLTVTLSVSSITSCGVAGKHNEENTNKNSETTETDSSDIIIDTMFSTETESVSEENIITEMESVSESEILSESEETSESETSSESETTGESENETSSESEHSSESEKPTESQTPSESEELTETQTSSGSEKVTETQKPSESEKPTETQKPSESEKPTESQKPSESEKPTESQRPSESEKPTESQRPSESEKPTESQRPSESEKPTESQRPSETTKPTESEKPTESTPPSSESTQKPLDAGEQMAKDIVARIISSKMSDFEKAMTIHDWLTFNIDYDFSFTHYDLEETLKDKKGVCQGYALAFESMAKYAGLDAVMITGTANNGSGYQSHAWNRVKLDGKWYNVDVTWDDPATAGKNPSDHSGNRYEYFLISDAVMNQDHKAEKVPSQAGSCSSNYDRTKVYKTAIKSGNYGNVIFASSVEEAVAEIDKKHNANTAKFELWYYDTSLNESKVWDKFEEITAKCKYPVSAGVCYPPVNELTRYEVQATTSSEWKKYPLATNGTEFEQIYNQMLVDGVKEYTIRYETADGSIDTGAVNANLSLSYMPYYNGNYYLMTITIH